MFSTSTCGSSGTTGGLGCPEMTGYCSGPRSHTQCTTSKLRALCGATYKRQLKHGTARVLTRRATDTTFEPAPLSDETQTPIATSLYMNPSLSISWHHIFMTKSCRARWSCYPNEYIPNRFY